MCLGHFVYRFSIAKLAVQNIAQPLHAAERVMPKDRQRKRRLQWIMEAHIHHHSIALCLERMRGAGSMVPGAMLPTHLARCICHCSGMAAQQTHRSCAAR